MPKLIVKQKAEILKELDLLYSKPFYTVGSDPDNDIVIDDKKVSMHHIRIERMNSSYYLEDLGSAFGTHLNGRPLISRVQIVHGDEVTIGQHNLTFEHLHSTSAADSDLDALQPGSPDAQRSNFNGSSHDSDYYEIDDDPLSIESQERFDEKFDIEVLEEEAPRTEPLQTQSYSSGRFYLLVIHGPYLGKKYELKFGDNKIGRDTTLNDIVIRNNAKGELDPSVSRRHATVTFRDNRFFVSDKRSKTRTYVNQIKLTEHEEIPLYEGDELEIVSDQESTIFRLITDDTYTLKPPVKSGVWWFRHRLKVGIACTLLFALLMISALALTFQEHLQRNSQPETLKLTEESWFMNEGPQEEFATGVAGEEATLANLAISDLDGDGQVDVVLTRPNGQLIAINGLDKSLMWENAMAHRGTIPVVLADLNANGLKDVLAIGNDTRARAFDGVTGAEIWISPILGETVSGRPLVADLNDDGLNDVVIAIQSGAVHFGYNEVAQVNWQKLETSLLFRSVPSAADHNGDGMADIFLGTEEGTLLIFDGNTHKLSKVFRFAEEVSKATGEHAGTLSLRFPAALGDINSDDKLDIVLSANSGDCLAFESASLTRLWHEKLAGDLTVASGYLSPAIADLDGNDIDDVILQANRAIRAMQGSATKAESQIFWNFYLDENDYFVTPVSITDLNKDGSDEVIVGTQRGAVMVINGLTGKIITQLNDAENHVVSPILVGDIGADGNLDLLFMRRDGNVYKAHSNSGWSSGAVTWGQAFGNAQNSSRIAFTPPSLLIPDVTCAVFALLTLLAGLFTFKTRRDRQRLIKKNQSG